MYDRFAAAAASGDTAEYQALYNHLSVLSVVEMPMRELLNEKIRGFIWAHSRRIETGPIEKQRFSQQGLIGLFRLRNIPLVTCLRIAQEVEPYQIEIYVPSGWRL